MALVCGLQRRGRPAVEAYALFGCCGSVPVYLLPWQPGTDQAAARVIRRGILGALCVCPCGGLYHVGHYVQSGGPGRFPGFDPAQGFFCCFSVGSGQAIKPGK